ncbi:MAG: LysM peptidoglycan-binding domain-containing protein [Planctomycetales bacterium]|nr:LysM peptidoglycan-binding domain-containing protein [Planctomycetales bacterium]
MSCSSGATLRIMMNPFRVPIVLLIILGAMLAFVHASHQQRASAPTDDLVGQDELSLRRFGAAPRTTALRNDRPLDLSQTRPVVQANVADLLAAAISPTLGVHTESVVSPAPSADSSLTGVPKPLATDCEEPLILPSIRSHDLASANRANRSAMKTRRDFDSHVAAASPAIEATTAAPAPGELQRNDALATQAAERTAVRHLRGPHVEETTLGATHRPRVDESARSRVHRINDGDTLKRLAARYLGDESRYSEIFAANRDILVRPDLLPIGQSLKIPVR